MLRDAPEPTGDQCNTKAIVYEDAHEVRRACWYPQMGGYCSKAIIAFNRGVKDPCFEALVWHDGEFPFDDDEPKHLHHCDAEQFIEFGQFVQQAVKEANG